KKKKKSQTEIDCQSCNLSEDLQLYLLSTLALSKEETLSSHDPSFAGNIEALLQSPRGEVWKMQSLNVKCLVDSNKINHG
ncbi:hypothetical protein, partial [Thiolapillus sp.]|uniref:hypothetical protein n=1 Tax=Thiolapillus sp. TaxID=2017437 RepID=UPI003AF7C88D